MASLGGAFTGIRNNAVLQQIFLYQVVGGIIGPVLGPFAAQVAQTAFDTDPTVALSAEVAAEAVLRGAWKSDRATQEARYSGVNSERFAVLELLAGNAPAPQELAVALRRGFINHDRYLVGIAQGRLRNEWADTIQQLSVMQPTPEAALAAYLEGQITEADARAKWAAYGGDPANFDWMFNTQGQAPTPVQALEMANRKIISWDGVGPQSTSFQQAFLEGPWRNKWLDAFKQIGVYLPPPRTVVAMLRAGSISTALATEWLSKQGLPQEAVAAYIADASAQKTAGSKDLAQSTVTALYRDSIITAAQATTSLEALGYSADESKLILAVVDAQIFQRFSSAALGRIHSRYVAWRISKADVLTALKGLGVDPSGVTKLLALWDIERTDNSPTLSAAQVAKAWHDLIITQDEAIRRLVEHGYSEVDAWLYLSQYQGSPAPNKPAGAPPSPSQPKPGG